MFVARLVMIVTLLVALAAAAPRPAADPPPRPNVVIVLADDLGTGDLGCYDPRSRIPTPALDRLAQEGLRFTDAHSASAVCTPSRYALLTGRYAWRSRLKSGVLWNGWARGLLEPDRPTIATVLRDAGYMTTVAGKWHLGWDWASTDGRPVTASAHDHVDYARPVTNGPVAAGFDVARVIPASLDMPPYLFLETDRAAAAPTDHTPGSARRWSGGGGFWRAGPMAPGFDFTDVLPDAVRAAERAIRAAAERRDAGTPAPFLVYLPLPAPHTPWMPTPEFQGSTPVGWYGDFVAQTDASVGRVLAALETHGFADDTIVIVTSDNGAHWPRGKVEQWGHDSHAGLRGQKADIWEGGHRVPLLVRWPGVVAPGTTTDRLAGHVDLLPTIVAALGIPLPEDAAPDGIDLGPILAGRADAPGRGDLVCHSLDGTFALRVGPWKLIPGELGSGGFTTPKHVPPAADAAVGGQLYHLGRDPGETTNLWAEHPEVVARLTERLAAIRAGD